MFPTRLGMALCDKYALEKICISTEQMVYCITDCIADVQKMSAAGSPYDEIEMVFLTWMSLAPNDPLVKNGKLHRKLSGRQKEGLQKIIDTTKQQVNGQIIGMLAKLTDDAVNDRERVTATSLLHDIMNGADVEANADRIANYIVKRID